MARTEARRSSRQVDEEPVRRKKPAETTRRSKPEAKPTRRSAKTDEAPTRKTRSAKASPEATTRKRRSSEEDAPAKSRRKVSDTAEKPTRKSRTTEAPAKTRRTRPEPDDAPVAKKRRGAAVEESAKTKKRAKATEDETETPVKAAFNPYARLDAVLDDIEKTVGLSESAMDTSEKRLSTGNLMLDILLGGGITSGWYTNFGQEQSCKTTGAVTILSAAINSQVPILTYFDFEGCLTYDAKVVVNGVEQHLGDLFAGLKLEPYIAFDVSKLGISIKTPCGQQPITVAMYKGPKPCVRIELDNGASLEGYKHRELVCTAEDLLVWKYIEDLKVGDRLVVRP